MSVETMTESPALGDAPPEPAAARRPIGHVPPPRWIRTTARWQEETDQSLPFSAELDVAGLTMANSGWVFDADVTLGDLWAFFATRVRNWNATAIDRKTGDWVTAPGPEEIGWKAFALVDLIYTTYLVLMLNDAINGGDARADEKKASASPAAPGSDAN